LEDELTARDHSVKESISRAASPSSLQFPGQPMIEPAPTGFAGDGEFA
jgi:hypothetical protein